MDSFESIVATILEQQGFWVRTSYKVALTKDEKRKIGRHSAPRWELDVVGYRPGDNVLRVVECKSYLDSRGVAYSSFDPAHRYASRYKLFTEPTTRKVVLARLVKQLKNSKLIPAKPTIEFCLAAGKIVAKGSEQLQEHFDSNGWLLLGPDWIREQLAEIAEGGYDNAIASVTAKLLLRGNGK